MGPNSLPPMVAPKKSTNIWVIVALVFAIGIGAGVFIPSGMVSLGLTDAQTVAVKKDKEPITMPLPNGQLRRLDPPVSNQPVAAVALAKVSKVDKSKQKMAAIAFRKSKKSKGAAKVEKEKAVPVRIEKAVAKIEEATSPSADLIEEVPSAPSVLQVEKMIQNNAAAKGKAAVRPVSLPPGQVLAPHSNLAARSLAPLPILKTDPKADSKTYPVTINNASFSKANLNTCGKRCALLGLDASGNPIRAVIDGATYASALLQHNGTINISGQPRFIKNQQVLVVENITFNLAPTARAVSKRPRAAAVAAPVSDKGGYTEVSFENDDLKPGTIIKNRKQIPIEDQQEIPTP